MLFYGRLFEIAPEVKPLFKGDMTEQGKKLMQMLAVAVNGLPKLDTIVPAVQDMGVRHNDYGVAPEHYDSVGAALLWTLEQRSGRGLHRRRQGRVDRDLRDARHGHERRRGSGPVALMHEALGLGSATQRKKPRAASARKRPVAYRSCGEKTRQSSAAQKFRVPLGVEEARRRWCSRSYCPRHRWLYPNRMFDRGLIVYFAMKSSSCPKSSSPAGAAFDGTATPGMMSSVSAAPK